MGPTPNNYFKVATSLARPIDCIFTFDGHDEVDTKWAWDAARDAAAVHADAMPFLPALRIAAWKKPALPGPWSKVPVVL